MTVAAEYRYDTMREWALHYARAGFQVFPLNADKEPISEHGMNDATTDHDHIERWWTTAPNALIGCRIPADIVVLDIDPRHGGHNTWNLLQQSYGPVPETRHHYSGRGDGGCHYWLQRPDGKLSIKPLTEWAHTNNVGHPINGGKRWSSGIDILHHNHRYTILPPSIHAATGQPYWWGDKRAPVECPGWLANYITAPPAIATTPAPRLRTVRDDNSIADWYTDTHRWADILHGWQLVKGDGDSDGSAWRHPNASANQSATIKHGCLFVYSDNTEFEVTEHDNPNGYTRFRAWALLEHGGDLTAAARAAREERDGQTGTNGANGAPGAVQTALVDDFWQSRPALAHIHQAAQARQVAPTAVLGCTLAWIAAHTPPSTKLPPTIGSMAPLSLLVGLHGSSGAGKSSAMECTADLLTDVHHPQVVGPLPVGSGEGVVEAYHEWVEETDGDGKKQRIKRQTKWGALLSLDEGGILKDLSARKGSTILPVLRTAWSGGDPGQANASAETRRSLRRGSYTFALISAWQDAAAQFLLADVDGGTPQRFVWFSTEDEHAPPDDELPAWPGRLQVDMPGNYQAHVPFTVTPAIERELRQHRRAVLRGELEVNPIDAHRNLNRLKIAGCLALLDGRSREITDDDWRLAGTILDSSDNVRWWVARKAQIAAENATEAAAARQARREQIVADTLAERALTHATKAVWRATSKAVAEGRTATRSDLMRSISSRDRKHVTVEDAATEAGRLQWVVERSDGTFETGSARPS